MVFDRTALSATINSSDAGVLIEFYRLYLEHAVQMVARFPTRELPTDPVTIGEMAHGLASSSRVIGAYTLAQTLSALEQSALNNDSRQLLQLLSELHNKASQTFEEIEQEIGRLEGAPSGGAE